MSIITHVLLTMFATVLASGETVRDLWATVTANGTPRYFSTPNAPCSAVIEWRTSSMNGII